MALNDIRSGAIKMQIPLPFVVGCDLAGTVERVGPEAKRFKPGDRVWGSNQGLFGRQGTFAEYAAVDEKWLYPTPDGVADETAAAARCGVGLKMYCDPTTGELLVSDTAARRAHLWAWSQASQRPVAVHAEGPTLEEVVGLARDTGARVHFCHVSDRAEVDILRAAKADGLPISVGVTPHHLYLTHDDAAHLSSGHLALTGHLAPIVKSDQDPPSDRDTPHMGAVVSKLRPGNGTLPPFVTLPWKVLHPAAPGGQSPGQHGGWLGKRYDPFVVTGDPNQPNWSVPELGLPDVNTQLWSGFFAPADTPAPIVQKLVAELGRALADPGVQSKLKAMAVNPGGPSGADFGKRIDDDLKAFAAVVKEAKLTFQ